MIYSKAGEQGGNLDYDIAIYGAGPAGNSLALALSGEGLRIGLFEAGGLEPPPIRSDHPYAGESIGLPYDLASTRLRYLGGTSNHWGGWCRPLDASDFEQHDHIPRSGWPIGRAELDTHLEAAMGLCEVPHGGLGLGAFEHDFGYDGFIHQIIPELEAKNFLFSPPTRFGTRYRRDLEAAADIECRLDSTLVDLRRTGNAIDTATIQAPRGAQFDVTANVHVLAMGAIENARLLLHSRAVDNDNVGRYFADHLGKTIGVALAEFGNRYFKHPIHHGGATFDVMPHLSFTRDVLREHELTNFGVILDKRSRQPLAELGTAVENQLHTVNRGNPNEFRVLLRMENTPNPNSRLVLGKESDGHGVPRASLDWRINALDLESVNRICRLLGPLFGRAGARLRVDFDLDDAFRRPGSYQSHHLGTTRMSAEPETGVVDINLRCHDLDNLYVAGSSVFPTYGFANPTLTLVALSLRLAEHLSTRMGKADG